MMNIEGKSWVQWRGWAVGLRFTRVIFQNRKCGTYPFPFCYCITSAAWSGLTLRAGNRLANTLSTSAVDSVAQTLYDYGRSLRFKIVQQAGD